MFTYTNKFAVRVLRGSSIIHLMLAVVLALSSTMVLSSSRAEAADGAPPGFRLPFRGMAYISQGPRCKIFTHWGGIDHEAIDFVVYSSNAPVLASEAGWARAYPDTYPGGNMVKIYHSNGMTSIYGHLRDFTGIGTNGHYWVNKGQRIGTVGNTGYATDVHLHFGVVWTSNQAAVQTHNIPGIHWYANTRNYPFDPTSLCERGGYDGWAYGP